jgi:hypothetical protein
MPEFKDRRDFTYGAYKVIFTPINTNDDAELEELVLFKYRICGLETEIPVIRNLGDVKKDNFLD